jgi:hypothetical protein
MALMNFPLQFWRLGHPRLRHLISDEDFLVETTHSRRGKKEKGMNIVTSHGRRSGGQEGWVHSFNVL